MHVVDLRNFYETALGRLTAELLARRLKQLAPAGNGQTVMGLGFAHPYFTAMAHEDATSFSFMQARQGVIHWPQEGPVRSALVDECDLPLVESVIDLALVVHGLEFADTPDDMLHEVWRVLAPQGRLVLVIPNRRGLWAASEKTPFGHGQPFSRQQIAELLKETKFDVTRWDTALHFPPMRHSTAIKTARHFEQVGRVTLSAFSGVTIVEAVKQVYAFSSGKRARRLVPRFRPVLLPAPHGMRASRQDQFPSRS
jgi:SAM-dependent methyltransferase